MAKLTNGIGLGGETRQLVLGDSFRNYRCNRGPKGLHTIRYDFKPASVDTTKMGDIEFGENNKVTVTMPNVESSGLPQTVFKGSRKPHLKECVLIIDNETGELTLERLAHNITVKKTRAEGSSRAGLPRPITPSFETQSEKSGPSSNSNGNNGNGNSNGFNNNSSGNYNQRKLSPPMINGSMNGGRPISPKVSSSLSVGGHGMSQGGSPSSFTPKSNRSSPNVAFGLHRSPLIQSSQPSMPTNGQLTSTHIKPDDEMIGILSESSSDSSEHGSSSSDNSDSSSDEDDEIKQEVVEASKSLNDDNYPRAGSSSSSGSDSSSDSDDENDHSTPTPMVTNNSKIKQSPNNGSSSSAILPSMPSMLSMPKFTQLSEDLQLSESGSDSD